MSWDAQLVELEVSDADVHAVLDCLRSGWLTMGPRTQALEAELAKLVGTANAPAVSSGTAALHLACRVAGLGPGDEAIVPALTFVASAHAPRYCGAEVVLCDSTSERDAGLDVAAVEARIGPRTKAVIAVHMFGYPAAVEALRELCDEHGLTLIEDCAEAIAARTPGGAMVGSVGQLGCFSFFSKKQLAIGEGGAIASDDDELAAQVRLLRSHAMTSVTWERHRGHGLGYDITDVGFNYRIDEPRAALALSRLERLAGGIEARRAAARRYRALLAAIDGVEPMYAEDQVELSSHFALPVLVADAPTRDRLKSRLSEAGVQTTVYPALHRLSLYADRGADASLPNAAAIADRQLCLPLHPLLSEQQIESIVARLAAAL